MGFRVSLSNRPCLGIPRSAKSGSAAAGGCLRDPAPCFQACADRVHRLAVGRIPPEGEGREQRRRGRYDGEQDTQAHDRRRVLHGPACIESRELDQRSRDEQGEGRAEFQHIGQGRCDAPSRRLPPSSSSKSKTSKAGRVNAFLVKDRRPVACARAASCGRSGGGNNRTRPGTCGDTGNTSRSPMTRLPTRALFRRHP